MHTAPFRYAESPELSITVQTGDRATGKLYDVELHFRTGLLAGLKLTGFAVWQPAGTLSEDARSVTLPSRIYQRDGESWSAAFLRPEDGSAFSMADAHANVRTAILTAVSAYEGSHHHRDELSTAAF